MPVDVRLAERECSLVDGLGEDEGMSIRFPAPLRPGDRIGVTSPSAGVTAELLPRPGQCASEGTRSRDDLDAAGSDH